MVLRRYGQRMMSPDPRLKKEIRAYGIWREALERLEEILIAKRIVVKPHWIKLVSNNDGR
jgi:hypothetical protein